MFVSQPSDLFAQRRLRLWQRAAKRPLNRAAKLAERLLQLLGTAAPRLLVERLVTGERERDAEQTLDDALVQLARQVDPRLELCCTLVLARRGSRHRGQGGHLPEDPENLTLGVGELRLVAAAVGEDHAHPPATRGDRGADDRARLQPFDVLSRKFAFEVAGELEHAVLRERPHRERRGLRREVEVREQVHVDAVAAGGIDAPASGVVAEDQDAPHRGAAGDPLAEPAVEVVAETFLLALGEDIGKDLQRVRARAGAGVSASRRLVGGLGHQAVGAGAPATFSTLDANAAASSRALRRLRQWSCAT